MVAALQAGWKEPFDLVVIAGHGTAKSIRFGIDGASTELRMDDLEWLKTQHAATRLRPGSGRVLLRSCNTGQTFGGASAKKFRPSRLNLAAFAQERNQNRPIDRIVNATLHHPDDQEAVANDLDGLMHSALYRTALTELTMPVDVKELAAEVQKQDEKAPETEGYNLDHQALNRALLEVAYPETTRASRQCMVDFFRAAFPDAAPQGIIGMKVPVFNPFFVYTSDALSAVRYRSPFGRFLSEDVVLRK